MKRTTIGLTMFTVLSFVGAVSAHAMITSTLDLGSTGSNVTELQNYLSETTFYPSKLVTGYFGNLTAGGVQQFQISKGIVSAGTPATTGFGRVGPITLAAINNAMGSGSVSTEMSPILTASSVQLGSSSVTISWTTNVPTQGQVYYDTNPLVSNEATGPRQQPYVSGAYKTDNSGQTNHSIVLTNLQANTTYYFLTRAVDNNGNLSMTLPTTFRTNQ